MNTWMKAAAVLCVAVLTGWPMTAPAQNIHTLPLVRPADFAGQESLVRIVNRSDTSGTVQVTAIDDTGERFGPVTLTLGAQQTLNITSRNLERGNAAVGLPVGVGDGEGSWRLELATALTIDALAYIRTPDGFLTSMHDVAPVSGGNHWVPIFNPGSNIQKVSHLRLINPGTMAAEVTVTGRDDLGDEASGTVRLTLPAGTARTLSAQALETGVGLDGSLGDGAGKWSLSVRSTTTIQVMSLLATPTGHLANLSTAPSNGRPGGVDDHGDTCLPATTATVVGADSTTAGRLETHRDVDAFRFELPSTGSLIVRTTAADGRTSVGPDTVGRLYRGDTLVAWDDDAVGVHFRIDESEVPAGTWCVEVGGIGTATGAYTLHVEFDGEPPPPPPPPQCEGATVVGANSTTAGRLETRGEVDAYLIELRSVVSLRVQTTGSTDTIGRLYQGTTLRGSDDDDGTGTNFRIALTQAPAGTWCVQVRGWSNATGPYTLHVETRPVLECGWTNWVAGHALDRRSSVAAQRDAINFCRQFAERYLADTSQNCSVRTSFTSCAALAVGARNDGSGSCLLTADRGSSREAAERAALTDCRTYRGGVYRGCRIAVAQPSNTRMSFCTDSGTYGAIATRWGAIPRAGRSAPAIGGSAGRSAEKQEFGGVSESP